MRSMRCVVSVLSVTALLTIPALPARGEPQVGWHEELGGGLEAVAAGPHGAIYVAGHHSIGWRYEGPMILARLRPSGDLVWSRSWQPKPGSPNRFSAGAEAVDVAANGVVYVAGFVQRNNCEGGGWFLRSYGAGGRLLRWYGTRRSWTCRAAPQHITDVAVRDGLVVVTGNHYGCCGSEGFHDGWVRAFDAGLRPRWKAPFEPPASLDPEWVDRAESVSIGARGNISVAGWAATSLEVYGESIPDGTLILEKLTAGGTVLWTHRPGVAMDFWATASLSRRGDRLMVVASVLGSEGWLGRFTVGGDLVWSRTWGTPGRYVGPADVSVSSSGSTWVVGVKRDPRGQGRILSVRLFGRTGNPLWKTSLRDGARWLDAGGVSAYGLGVLVTGTATNRYAWDVLGGQVWRIES